MSVPMFRLRVRNWEKFQHYRRRNPPWIKLHNEILDNYEFGCLQDASKWHAVGIWLLASRHDNAIPDDPTWIAQRIGAREVLDIDGLVSAGFIERYNPASGELAPCKQNGVPEGEGEAEGETEGEKTLSSDGQNFELEVQVEPKKDPPEWMHEVWHEVFGIDGHPLKMTAERSQKYERMYQEQLADTPDPVAAWRAVLETVTSSSHHMGNRAYLMPESLLINESRRSRWVQQTLDRLKTGASGADRRLYVKQGELMAYLDGKGAAA